jgi:ABC-type bacteriocin/lantibiotic exporter with double-glycine peptidase domain
MILGLHNLKIDEETLSEKCQTTTLGTSADDVVQAARELGFSARKEQATFDELRQYLANSIFPILFINLLAIDGYNTTHAVIVEEISEQEIKVLDPRVGIRDIDIELMRYSWQRAKNVAIIIEKV